MEDDSWEERASRWNQAIADNPAFTEATVDRTQRCVHRDKNRPCVVIWSMGNECAYGCTFEAALAWTKEFDHTRLTHFESARYTSKDKKYDYSNIDLHSRMYPAIEEIHDYFAKTRINLSLCANTAMQWATAPEILRIISRSSSSTTAPAAVLYGSGVIMPFTWARPLKERKNTRTAATTWSTRRTATSVWMVWYILTAHRIQACANSKNVHRPARVVFFDQEKKEAVLHNYMDYVNLKDYLYITYTVNCDGSMIGEGCICG